MSPNMTQPSEMNIFVSNQKFFNQNENENENELEIDEIVERLSATKTKFDDGKFILGFSSEKIGFKFWIGFKNVSEAEMFRQELTSN